MRHFLDSKQLTLSTIHALIERAIYFKTHGLYPSYPTWPVALLFYENSTRTRLSFELAALRLSMPVVNLDLQRSSEQKGECIEDTLNTLMAMGIKLVVIRHSADKLPARLAATCAKGVQIINAGDGMHEHPTQAMLDLMTILEKKPQLESLKIALIGDVRHSRVAHSLQSMCKTVGVGELVMVAPAVWQPTVVHYGHVTTSLSEGMADADVVMCLRVQQERLLTDDTIDLDDYHRDYGVTRERMTHAKPDAIVMHPGPVNRGVELDSDVADGPQSCILQQVTNGVFMRTAILEWLVCGASGF